MRSTKEVIYKEVERGGNIAEQIIAGKAQWKDLFTKHTFFTADYKYYLSVITASTSEEAQLPWSGYIESRVRHLVKLLEDHPSIALAHPFNKGFARVHRCHTEAEVEKAKGGSLEHQAKDIATATTGHGLAAVVASSKSDSGNTEQKANSDSTTTMVYTTTHYIGLELFPGMFPVHLQLKVLLTRHCCSLRKQIHASMVFMCRPSADLFRC
jgi:poly(A) polymerase